MIAPVFELKPDTPIADFMEAFQLELGDGFYLDIRDLNLIRKHENKIYIVVASLLGIDEN